MSVKSRTVGPSHQVLSQAEGHAYAKAGALLHPGHNFYVLQNPFGGLSVSEDRWGWKVLETHFIPLPEENDPAVPKESE